MSWKAEQYEPDEVRRLKKKLKNLSCKCSSCYQASAGYTDLRLINIMSTTTLKELRDREVQCKSRILPQINKRYVDIIYRAVLLYINLLRRAGVKKVCKDEGTETINSSINSNDKSTGRSIKFLQKPDVIGFGPEVANFLNRTTFVNNRLKDKACATFLSSMNRHDKRIIKRRIKPLYKITSNKYKHLIQTQNSKRTSSTDLPTYTRYMSQKNSNLHRRVTFSDLRDSTNEVGYKPQCINCLRLDNTITSLEPFINKKIRTLVKYVMESRFSKSNANTSIQKIKNSK